VSQNQLFGGSNRSCQEANNLEPRSVIVIGAGFGAAKARPPASHPAIAVKSTQLGHDFPGDPADRIIVATSILESAALITKDSRIREYPAVTSVW
jgi:hypothetical protein